MVSSARQSRPFNLAPRVTTHPQPNTSPKRATRTDKIDNLFPAGRKTLRFCTTW